MLLFKSGTLYAGGEGTLHTLDLIRAEHFLLTYQRLRLRLVLAKPPEACDYDSFRFALYERGAAPLPPAAAATVVNRFREMAREGFLPAAWRKVETAFVVESGDPRQHPTCGIPLLRGVSRETGSWQVVERLWGAVWPHEHLIVGEPES